MLMRSCNHEIFYLYDIYCDFMKVITFVVFDFYFQLSGQ